MFLYSKVKKNHFFNFIIHEFLISRITALNLYNFNQLYHP